MRASWFAPVVRVNLAQAKRLRMLHRLVERQAGRIKVLTAENEVLRARVAVLADLADPDARRLAAAVLKTIERL